MMIHRPAGRLPLRAAAWGFAAMLVATVPLAAQSRSSHGGGGGGGRSAHSTGSSHSGGGGAPHSSGGGAPQSSGGGRTAHEVPGGSPGGGHREPGGDHGGGNWHGDHDGHGGGGWRGGHGGYYYPWGWGGGFWPSFSFWYGDPYYYAPYGGYGYYGNYGYGGYGGGYGGYGYDRYNRNDMGALDLDVSPGRTHVFVNGEDLGEVDKYDGWPGYLWLPRGTYDVAFYLDGYQTIARQITIYPGSVIDVDDSLAKGPSVRPEDLASKTHERRDDRLRYERERRQQLDQQGSNNNDEDWRDRARRDRDRGYGRNDDRNNGPRYDRNRDNDNDNDNDSQKGSLRLMVDPEDASIYLDGRFIGTGSDVSMMRGGLSVTPGHHQISVVRPGRRAEERSFDVKSGEDVKVDVRLEGGAGR